MEDTKIKTIIVGVGNILLKDEGIGIHIAHAIQQTNVPDNLNVIDGGTSPDLPYYVKGCDKLIIIDAVRGGGKPGTIYRFHPYDVNMESLETASVHDLGLEQNLKMMKLMGNEPREVVVIGIEPKEIDWGTELSPELKEKIPEIIKTVLDEIKH